MSDISSIPENKEERDRILQGIRDYLSSQKLYPPLCLEELQKHTDTLLLQMDFPKSYRNWLMVLVNNELWKDTIASIPYNRRIFFLPQCMRGKECKGEFDEMGLLCVECGNCDMGSLQTQAENLGYAVLIAEGTTFVTSMIQQGKCDAIIGISCLETLERAFPYMVSQAVPGIAIPLYKAGCKDTRADIDWIWDALLLKSPEEKATIRLDKIQKEVNSWFSIENLVSLLEKNQKEVGKIAIEWLSKSGKRWRPLLSVAIFHALAKKEYPDFLKKIAIAIECFHKASLIHDDIEDDEVQRYEEIPLYKQYGIPVALNVGDYLIGLGYELLCSCGLHPEKIFKMLQIAAKSHITLCEGQGEELFWRKKASYLSLENLLSIFQEKTSPAFSVALILGALAANAPEKICQILKQYSDFLGIVYQIQDDIEDAKKDENLSSYPSLLVSLAWENGKEEERLFLLNFLSSKAEEKRLKEILQSKEIQEKAKNLKQEYIEKAYQSLMTLENTETKQLLYRILGKIIQEKK